jgi:hypothetical protein
MATYEETTGKEIALVVIDRKLGYCRLYRCYPGRSKADRHRIVACTRVPVSAGVELDAGTVESIRQYRPPPSIMDKL